MKRKKKGRERDRQPLVRSSLERFVYDTERSEGGVTALAGLPLAIQAFHAFGLAKACKRELRLKARQRGPTEAEWVELLTILQMAGGTSLEDLKIFKQDDGLARLWDLPSRTSPRSALDFLERFDDPTAPRSERGRAVITPESSALRALGRVNRDLIAEVQRRRPQAVATLDVDASIHPCDKKEALRAYEHGRGYQPVVVLWKEQDLIVHDQFRDGNVPAGMGNLGVIEGALESLPEGITKIRLRADSALYEHKLLRALDRRQIEFAVSADMTRELYAEVAALEEKDWQPLRARTGQAREERSWAEVAFVPEELEAKKGERPFRYFVIRLPPRLQQLDLFEEPPVKYVAVVTNRDLPGDELIHWHREKCGTIEKTHDRLKHDVGARLFPSGKFGVNAAWYRLAVLALNLFSAMTHLVLPEAWRGERLPTARFRFIARGARVVRHARRYVLVLSHLALGLLDGYLEAHRALAALTG